MITLAEESIVSCYVDAASLLLMVLLLTLSPRLRRREDRASRTYRAICWCVTVNCVMCFITNAMYTQTAPWCHTVVIIARTLRELLVLAVDVLWARYVYYKLYGDKTRNHWTMNAVILSFGALCVLQIVNLFTGILFTYSADNRFEPTPLLYYTYVFSLAFFTYTLLLVWRYDRKANKVRFFHIMPMILPVFVTISTRFFTQYDIGILGYAIGVTMVQFSRISENRFLDAESGLYNRGYLAYLFDLAMMGKNASRSALILNVDGNLSACFEIVHATVHQNADVIREEEKKLLMFSNEDSLSAIQYQASLVTEAAEQYNAAHPDNRVQITAHSRMRAADEDVFSFLRRVIEDQQTGDEMRGIVSMISELDRLDEELKLAADIQINMLPMIFPPFPERHEFDLYASMDPAKEVGGDFYDFFLVDQDHLALVIADVSGKGIPAALFMMVSKTLIKNQLMTGITPAEALTNVNAQLCERNAAAMFVTVWAAVVEISTGKGLACNAGHEKPALRRSGERFELLDYRHNMFVGVSKKARYADRPFELRPGDSLFVYTDGAPEARNADHEMFGSERLEAALNLDPDADPTALLGNVRRAVDDFVRDEPQFDDLTMLSFKYYGPAEESN